MSAESAIYSAICPSGCPSQITVLIVKNETMIKKKPRKETSKKAKTMNNIGMYVINITIFGVYSFQ